MSTRCLGQPGFAVERHCEMRCERDALQDALRDAMEEMRQTLKLNTKDSIPGIATTRSIGWLTASLHHPMAWALPSLGAASSLPKSLPRNVPIFLRICICNRFHFISSHL